MVNRGVLRKKLTGLAHRFDAYTGIENNVWIRDYLLPNSKQSRCIVDTDMYRVILGCADLDLDLYLALIGAGLGIKSALLASLITVGNSTHNPVL
jgi:hypothetical protein